MAAICKSGFRECDGCMSCQSNDPVYLDYENDPIYPGDTYYDIDGDIIQEDNIMDYLDRFRRVACEEYA